ncbi:phosphopentomutase [Acidobacteriia bacterium AH_259_A11_L15]|nr:phosphopentomutase [Acidobacteriia bacterium AH_259_A11_L15]
MGSGEKGGSGGKQDGRPFRRVVLLVLDSVGIGAMPDAARFGDVGRDTLGHVAASRPLKLPTLVRLGLANIKPLPHLEPPAAPAGAYGKAAIASNGKDTTTGHWEMAGFYQEHPFPTYPKGFPAEVIEKFEAAVGRKVLGNQPASGTEIIQELGEEHLRTGRPIVYTSADSVFQVAAHEEVIPVEELYRMCRVARELLVPPHQVGRVIARPFVGRPGNFSRTERRKDFAIVPPQPTLLDRLTEKGVFTCGIGKIYDIYCGRGLTAHAKTKNNAEGVARTLAALEEQREGLLFTNLADFDMLYGHRKNVEGYARALEEADEGLGRIVDKLGPRDLLLVTADHGCDPDPVVASTDHSREYVPVLAYSPGSGGGVNLGTRESLADTGQTIAENFGLELPFGTSFLSQVVASR